MIGPVIPFAPMFDDLQAPDLTDAWAKTKKSWAEGYFLLKSYWSHLYSGSQQESGSTQVIQRSYASIVNPVEMATSSLDLGLEVPVLSVASSIPENDEVFIGSVPVSIPTISNLAAVAPDGFDFTTPVCKQVTNCDVDFEAKLLALAVMKLLASGVSIKMLEEGEDS